MTGKLADDCFVLPPGTRWVPVDEALDRLRDSLSCVAGEQTLAVGDADGRILAVPVLALRDNPPFANAAVDGYGFAHAGTGDGPVVLDLQNGRVAAGDLEPAVVPPGQAIRILTGAPLPAGVDTVVLQENCRVEGSAVHFSAAPRKGANTRMKGEDVVAGLALFPAGHRLRAQDLALLAATGVDGLLVRKPLRVAVLATGSELAASGQPASPFQIYDSNRPMLAAMIRRWGMEVVDLGQVADDAAAVEAALNRGALSADVILATGGASAGDEDHVSAALKRAGSLNVWRIAMKPGRPLALGQWNGVPVFGLPGNPVAAFVCTLIFARPALNLLSGAGWTEPMAFTVPAAFSKNKRPGRREYLRARLNRDGQAEVFASEGSGRISGLSWAEGLVELGDEGQEITAGRPVRYLPFAGFGL